MSQHQAGGGKVTTLTLKQMKKEGKRIAMLTAYDYTMARLIDRAGVDMILVGDSAANVMAGHKTTLPITLDQMIYHGASVARGVEHAMVIVDMPFGTYQVSPEEAVRHAVRIMQETGADGIKLEGGEPYYETIKRIIEAGIPVVGHLGLTPQSVHQLGGYGLQAKSEEAGEALLKQAESLEQIGCCAIVLEKIPASLGARAAKQSLIPIIGIGAGAGVDGQVLVSTDMLGLDESFSPKFLRRFAHLGQAVEQAVGDYVQAVRSGDFPRESEAY